MYQSHRMPPNILENLKTANIGNSFLTALGEGNRKNSSFSYAEVCENWKVNKRKVELIGQRMMLSCESCTQLKMHWHSYSILFMRFHSFRSRAVSSRCFGLFFFSPFGGRCKRVYNCAGNALAMPFSHIVPVTESPHQEHPILTESYHIIAWKFGHDLNIVLSLCDCMISTEWNTLNQFASSEQALKTFSVQDPRRNYTKDTKKIRQFE